MQTFGTIVGYLILVALAVSILLVVIHHVHEHADTRRVRREGQLRELVTRRLGAQLEQFGWWLRTSPDARDIVNILAESWAGDYVLDYSKARDQFEALQKARFVAAQQAARPTEVAVQVKVHGAADAAKELGKLGRAANRAGLTGMRKTRTRQRDRK